MKKRNVFNYIFIIVIIALLSIPFFWKKYGLEIMNDIVYSDYIESQEIEIVNHNESNLILEYNSDINSKIYIHLIYNDYDKEIIELNIVPGKNVLTLEKNRVDLIKVYIYLEEPLESYKWIIFDT